MCYIYYYEKTGGAKGYMVKESCYFDDSDDDIGAATAEGA